MTFPILRLKLAVTLCALAAVALASCPCRVPTNWSTDPSWLMARVRLSVSYASERQVRVTNNV